MRWTEQAPDLKPARMRDLFPRLSAIDAIVLAFRVRASALVVVDPACRRGVMVHLRTRKTELGGLLLGSAYVAGPDLPDHWGPIICVDRFLASRKFQSSSVSLSMDTEIWNRARKSLTKRHCMVVGWYHSHPNLGAFFSGTDRHTQRAFFNTPYSLGLVIDPVRNEDAWFLGPEALPVEGGAVLNLSLTDLVGRNGGSCDSA